MLATNIRGLSNTPARSARPMAATATTNNVTIASRGRASSRLRLPPCGPKSFVLLSLQRLTSSSCSRACEGPVSLFQRRNVIYVSNSERKRRPTETYPSARRQSWASLWPPSPRCSAKNELGLLGSRSYESLPMSHTGPVAASCGKRVRQETVATRNQK